jgi:mono/diheme cytochrome c family protein
VIGSMGACADAGTARTPATTSSPVRHRPPLLLAALTAAVLVVGSCGADSNDSAALDLSPTAREGRKIANSSGCASCHGNNGQGVTGPPFQGLYGSEVHFKDADPQIADDAYITEAIKDPSAKLVDGYSLKMPSNNRELGTAAP